MTTPETPDQPQEEYHDTTSGPDLETPTSAGEPGPPDNPSPPASTSNSRKKWLFIGGGISVVAVVVVVVVVVLLTSGGGGGGSADTLQLVPEDVEALLVLDVALVASNPRDFPGDADDFAKEILQEIDSELDTEEIGFNQIKEFVILVHPQYGDEGLLITGDFPFDDIREDWDDQDFEDDSYRSYEIWDGDNYYVLLEDQRAIFVSDYEDFAKDVVKLIDDKEGSVAGSADSPMRSILDNLSPAPAVVAVVSDFCDGIVSGCVGFGAAYAGADLDRQEVMTDLAVLFSSERRAERAFEDYDDTLELMEDVLDDFAEEADDFSGLPNAEGVDVDDLELKGLFITASGIIEVEEE